LGPSHLFQMCESMFHGRKNMTQTTEGRLTKSSIRDGDTKFPSRTKSIFCCVRGGVATMFAIGLPALLTAVGVASDFAVMEMKRTSLQAAADVSALAAAKELSIASSTDTAIINAANNYVAAEIRENNATAVVTPSVNRKAGSVTVAISEVWTPFFMHFIASGVTPINVTATAKLAGSINVCVLALNPSNNKTLYLDTDAKLNAQGCGVYSNTNTDQAIHVDNNATIKAALTCAVGGVKLKAGSSVTPAALTNCPPVPDPLASRAKPVVSGSCKYSNLVVTSGTMALTPGHYCGGLKVAGTAQVTLAPGTYVISDADLEVSGNASFTGAHVGFYLDGPAARLSFKDTATISLTGAVNAEMAGLLFFEDPAAPLGRQHHIASTNVQNLTGTIYLPQGYLLVDPNGIVAGSSAYTAIIVNRLEMTAGPELVLNSDYGSTDVPVPAGIKSSASVVLSN
jgi:Putative Flp pilus-assembly TadE/G-like